MTGTDRNGIYTYSGDDVAADWPTLLNLGVSSVSNAISKLRQSSIYKANNAAAANTLRDTLVAAGVTPSATDPILIYLTSNGRIIAWDGATWKSDGSNITSWLITGSEVATPATPITNAILVGSRGEASRFREEAGSTVIRVPAPLDPKFTGFISLARKYTGIATALITNGDVWSFGGNIGGAGYGWDKVKNNEGVIVRVPYVARGAAPGSLIRINYAIKGWEA